MQFKVELLNSSKRWCFGGPLSGQQRRANVNLTVFVEAETTYWLTSLTFEPALALSLDCWVPAGIDEKELLDAVGVWMTDRGGMAPSECRMRHYTISPDATATWTGEEEVMYE